jgi:cation diffusion facilitator CzcD-associated flavoprotein CzcO
MKTHKWDVKTQDGRTAHAKYLINAIGFAAKRHFPDWQGLDSFKGEMYHSSFWPEGGVSTKGKKVAVIGTGSTGIQIAQESAKDAASVTVFQRTPNLCLPMRQRKLTKEEQDKDKETRAELYRYRMTTFAGFGYDFAEKNTFDDTPEEREAFFEELWQEVSVAEKMKVWRQHADFCFVGWLQILARNIQGQPFRREGQQRGIPVLGEEDKSKDHRPTQA